MKRCPTCKRTYSDPNLSFCIEDGTPLVKEDDAYERKSDLDATLVSSPTSSGSSGDAGQGQPNAPSDWKGPAYQPPGQFIPPPPPATVKRKIWPWVLVIVLVLLVAVVGIGIAAAIVIPGMMKAARNNENPRITTINTNQNQNANQDSNLNSNSNSPLANENENANKNANGNANANGPDSLTEAPTDPNQVLSDLRDIEDEWTVANLNADKKKLARILADDYVGTLPNGTRQGKADYLRTIEQDKTTKRWEFEDLKLTLKGDRATLKGKVRFEREGDQDLTFAFTDKFVWREGRWQATGSEVSPVK